MEKSSSSETPMVRTQSVGLAKTSVYPNDGATPVSASILTVSMAKFHDPAAMHSATTWSWTAVNSRALFFGSPVSAMRSLPSSTKARFHKLSFATISSHLLRRRYGPRNRKLRRGELVARGDYLARRLEHHVKPAVLFAPYHIEQPAGQIGRA